MGQIWSQIEKLVFLEIWDLPWPISMATTGRGTFKCMPAKPVQAAAVGVNTVKDMLQEHLEQLSSLFKELVAGTKVLPIGVVNAVPGAIPAAYAPTLWDAESNLCHPKRCGQPKP